MGHISKILFSTLTLSLPVLFASSIQAEIVGHVEATIHHRFIVGNTTLPAGTYTFRMLQGTDLNAMSATSEDGNTSVEFLVRRSEDSHAPRHTELIFDRYGNNEFLLHIYEVGLKDGVTVIEPSREESRLEKRGVTPVEHTEEQEQ